MSNSVSVMLRLVIFTGRIRNVPQKNNTVDNLLGGSWLADFFPLSLTRSMESDFLGTMSSSSADSVGWMPLVAATGLPSSTSWSVASTRRLKLIDSLGSAGCSIPFTRPAPLLGCGGKTSDGVLLIVSGLNWKTTKIGKAPSSPAPRLTKAPFRVGIALTSITYVYAHLHS